MEETIKIWEIGYFSNIDGLLADPTRFIQDPAEWPEPLTMDYATFVSRLIETCVLIQDDTAYEGRFQPKRTLLDYGHFGHFHQQLGQALMLHWRRDPVDWWVEQKFSDPGKRIRDNLYGAVQDQFLKEYLPRVVKPGMRVLDLGCGPGYFSNKMARLGADVLGLDPSERYLSIARANVAPGARFEQAEIGKPGALDGLASGQFDLVFMSDALLFYFVPEAPTQVASLDVLLSDIRRVLKDEGRFISVEPHYLFWLAPWLGDPERPFTIFSEYNDPPGMRVTPTLSRLIKAFCQGGFCITDMQEMFPAREFEAVDRRAYYFARRFPLWQLYEMRKKP
ncbi:MAG: class I SAM-dependent methyltransferase [Rhodospirillales bacterium]|nr:class I SAM-dependent methyltransferase [Rhodospirillales bacterium]